MLLVLSCSYISHINYDCDKHTFRNLSVVTIELLKNCNEELPIKLFKN